MKIFVLLIAMISASQCPAFDSLGDILDQTVIADKVSEQIDRMNISFSVGFSEGDLIKGLPIGAHYDYDVGPSYKPHSYNRIDKYKVNMNLNIGTYVKEISDSPLSFSINRNQNFFFVRQFPDKWNAMKALPYLPNRLPITAKRALTQLEIGDFASIPANLSLAVSAGASTNYISPIIVNANFNAYWAISGEFNIQVYKLDESHIRLKLITTRSYAKGTTSNTNTSFSYFGFRAINNQIDRLIDRDLIQLGMSAGPASQFILDYIFDLTNPESAAAYDEILGSSFKFKDLVVLKNFGDNREIKKRLYSTYEKADKIFLEDSKLPLEKQRVRRLFKGFTNSTAKTTHLKIGFFLTSYTNDQTYSNNDITMINDQEESTEFIYPTFVKYNRSIFGNYLWGYEDIQVLTFFGLLPKETEFNSGTRIPDIGISFDRTDAVFTPHEQRKLKNLINNHIPSFFMKQIDWNDWLSKDTKHSSRISFKLVLNAEAYPYLSAYNEKELALKLLTYASQKNMKHLFEREMIKKIASKLHSIFQNKNNNVESSLKDLVAMNKYNIFQELGIGFLASLLPEDKLSKLVYFKMELLALDQKTIKLDFGRLNYEMLYRELSEIQSKIGNRSYDLRVPNPIQP